MRTLRITPFKRPHRLRIAACWLAGTFALLSVTSVATEAAQPSRDLIVVEGNRRVDAETVRSYFHAAPDGKFDDAARDAALKALIATGLFDKVSIDRSGERLVVHLSEAAVLDRVAFEGNKKVKDADLAAAIASRPRGALQRATVQADVKASSRLTGMSGAMTSGSNLRSSTAAMAASTLSMPSPRAQRPRFDRSISPATTYSESGSSTPSSRRRQRTC